ncbi:MAG: S8 family serine peptidase [Pseudomonadota bacterium]
MKASKAILAAAIAAALTGQATAAELYTAREPVKGQYIVVLKREFVRAPGETSRNPDVTSLAAEMANRIGLQVSLAYENALQGFVATANEKQLNALLADHRVDFVEEDGLVHASATQSSATWGLDRSDQRDLPLNTTYVYDTTASNVRAYILDTGILANHVDFGGRVLAGYTAISDGRGSSDCNGHGTHVAGTVGGATWGIAKDVRLVPVRVLGCNGSGTNSGVIAGIDWVAANHVKPAVANMSLGGGASTATDTAVTNLVNAGVFTAVAAGNDNANACNYSPARAASAMTVGSTTNTDARSSFSNFGTCLDIFAPGSSITSAWYTSSTATSTISGTSMASPHVAGVAALFLAGNPTATPSAVTTAVINNSTANKVTGAQTGSPNRLLYSRFGGTAPVDNPPTANFTFSCTALACSFNGSGSTDDNGISSYSWTFGDGTTGSGATPSKTYAAAGTYSVVLTVRDTANQSGTRTQSVTVQASSAPCTNCTLYTGTLSSGASAYQPNGSNYYSSISGTHRAWLYGPAGSDFDLYLERWNGSTWTTVARATTTSNNETVTYSGTPAYYRWRVFAFRGRGSYQIYIQRP